jgi:hypothetical protein
MEQREALERMSRGGRAGGLVGRNGAGPDALRVFVQEKRVRVCVFSLSAATKTGRGTAHLAGLDSTAPSPNIGLAPFCDSAPTPFCWNSGGHSIEDGTNGAQSDAPAVYVRICV